MLRTSSKCLELSGNASSLLQMGNGIIMHIWVNHMRILAFISLLLLLINLNACTGKPKTEVKIDEAIRIATVSAEKSNYKVNSMFIEHLKFKDKFEKGPIRLNWLVRTFSPDVAANFAKNDFWVVYFYPKDRNLLGGDYYVLVDLYSGNVIATKQGM